MARCPWLICLLVLVCVRCGAAAFTLKTAVEHREVAPGESFIYQLQAEGVSDGLQADLSAVTDFRVEFLGGRPSNRSETRIINGRVEHNNRKALTLSYRLTPRKEGLLSIPSVPVRGHGMVARSAPVQIRVSADGRGTVDMVLETVVTQPEWFVGQPITVTWNWFIEPGSNIRGFHFELPILDLRDFEVVPPAPGAAADPNGGMTFELPNGVTAFARQVRRRRNGRDMVLVTFPLTFIPRVPGNYTIGPSRVSAKAVAEGQRRRRPQGFFDDRFFDSLFDRGVTRRSTAESEPLVLAVRPLPSEGRPPGSVDLAVPFTVAVSADPVSVNVGDPIQLEVVLKGGPELGALALPPLAEQPSLGGVFKVTGDDEPGDATPEGIVFRRVVRATHPDVSEIPPLSFAWFDVDAGVYRQAVSGAIPIEVRAARVVTASDAEGGADVGVTAGGRDELEAWTRGIAHNYDGFHVLRPQYVGLQALGASPAWWGLLLGPPLVWCAVAAAGALAQRRTGSMWRLRAREARTRLEAISKRGAAPAGTDAAGEILGALRTHLGVMLELPPAALTFAEAAEAMESRGVEPALQDELRSVFDWCETAHYAGGSVEDPPAMDMAAAAARAARALERHCGSAGRGGQ